MTTSTTRSDTAHAPAADDDADGIAAERLHRKQRLAVAFRLFARLGLDEGAAGHISVRDPGRPDCYWMNSLDVDWAAMRASDLVLIGPDGDVVEGPSRAINPAGVAIHGQLLAHRPDITAIAHSHPIHGKAWSTLGRLIDPLTQDACAFFEDHVVVPFSGIVLDGDEGRHIASVMGATKAAILENHGLLTVGTTVDEAAYWFVSLERQCQVQLLAEQAGRPRQIDPDTARRTANVNGSPEVGRMQFRPLWSRIVREEPEVLG